MGPRSNCCVIDNFLFYFSLTCLFVDFMRLIWNLISDEPNDVTLETDASQDEDNEVDIIEEVRRGHEEAAKERSSRPASDLTQSTTKRPRLDTQQRRSTPTPSQPVSTRDQEPRGLLPQVVQQQQTQQQVMVSITMDQLESLVTNVASKVAATTGPISFHEAIQHQTSTLAQVVRGSGLGQEENLDREPRIIDRSWWLTLESVDVEDNSQTKL